MLRKKESQTILKNKINFGIFLGLSIIIGLISVLFMDVALFWISLSAVVFSLLVVFLATGTWRIISVPYLYLFYFIIFIFVGCLRFFSADRNYTLFWGIIIGIIFFSFGVFFASVFLKFNPRRECQGFVEKPLEDSMKGRSFDLAFFLLVGFSLALAAYYIYLGIQNVGTFPLISMILNIGTTREKMLQRLAFTHVPGAGYFYQFYAYILPFLFLISLGKYLLYRNPKWKYISLFLSAVIFLILLASGSRGPILIFIITIFIFFNLYYGKIKFQHLWKFALIGLFILIILTAFKFSTAFERDFFKGVSEALNKTAIRIFIIQAIPSNFVFDYFPKYLDFKEGRTWFEDLKGILPGHQTSFSANMAKLRSGLFGKKALTAPIGLFGEFYVNFGLLGVCLGMFMSGFILQGLHIIFVRSRKSIINLVLFAALTQAVAYLSLAGFVSVLFQFGVITFLLVMTALKIFYLLFSIEKEKVKDKTES